VRNPYVVGRRVYPSFAKTYLNRSKVRTGMITRSGVIASMMRRNGWPWGARWSDPDYQHFSSNGG
jgi:D-alanyl-D-alanine carboxypeptidase